MTDAITQATAERLRFSMRNTPLLEGGATMELVGENALHSHDIEDHVFLILQGMATFYFGDGITCQAEQYDGVTIPSHKSHQGKSQTNVRVTSPCAQPAASSNASSETS